MTARSSISQTRINKLRQTSGAAAMWPLASGAYFLIYPKQSRGATRFNIFPTTRQRNPTIVLILEIIDIPPRMLAIMLQSPISCYQASLATQPLDCVGRDIYIIPFFFQLSTPVLIFCMWLSFCSTFH